MFDSHVFAAGLFGFSLPGLPEVFYLALRVLAAVGGFVIGYLLTGPLVRFLVRVAVHKQVPDGVLLWVKVLGGLVVAIVVFQLMQFGPGGGGSGSGGGTGDGKGTGKGTGSGKNGKPDPGKQNDDGKDKGKTRPTPEETLVV